MKFGIAIKPFAAVVLLSMATCGAWAKDNPALALTDPVFGLRLPAAKLSLDVFPDELKNKCAELADGEGAGARLWIYASAREEEARYYVVGGYTTSAVVRFSGERCVGIGAVREVFDARYFHETPQRVLQELAEQFAARLSREVGGPRRLKTELRKQRVELDRLPLELRNAFAPFIAPAR